MSAFALPVGERIAVLGQFVDKVEIGLVEEVGIAAAYPQKGRFLAEIPCQLGIDILIHWCPLLLVYAYYSREYTGVAEKVRIFETDVHLHLELKTSKRRFVQNYCYFCPRNEKSNSEKSGEMPLP